MLISKLLKCQLEPVESGLILEQHLPQSDKYCRTLTSKLLECQPEPVEGGLI